MVFYSNSILYQKLMKFQFSTNYATYNQKVSFSLTRQMIQGPPSRKIFLSALVLWYFNWISSLTKNLEDLDSFESTMNGQAAIDVGQMLQAKYACQRSNIPHILNRSRMLKLCEIFNSARFCETYFMEWVNNGDCKFGSFSVYDNVIEITFDFKVSKGKFFENFWRYRVGEIAERLPVRNHVISIKDGPW